MCQGQQTSKNLYLSFFSSKYKLSTLIFFAFMFFVFRNISGTGCHIHKKLRKFNQQFSYNFLYQLTRFLGLANCNSRHIIKNSLDHIYSNTHGYVIDFEIEELFRNKKPQISQRQDYFLVKRRKYFIK